MKLSDTRVETILEKANHHFDNMRGLLYDIRNSHSEEIKDRFLEPMREAQFQLAKLVEYTEGWEAALRFAQQVEGGPTVPKHDYDVIVNQNQKFMEWLIWMRDHYGDSPMYDMESTIDKALSGVRPPEEQND